MKDAPTLIDDLSLGMYGERQCNSQLKQFTGANKYLSFRVFFRFALIHFELELLTN